MPSEEECAQVLRGVRWAGGITCVYCGSSGVVRRGWRKHLYQRYKCSGRWFNDEAGAAMSHSRLPLRFWFFTVFMMQFKVSVRELAKTLQHPLRHGLQDCWEAGGEHSPNRLNCEASGDCGAGRSVCDG